MSARENRVRRYLRTIRNGWQREAERLEKLFNKIHVISRKPITEPCIECDEMFVPERDYDCVGDPPRYVPCYERRCPKCVPEEEKS